MRIPFSVSHAAAFVTGVTTSQGIGLGMMVAGAAIWMLRRNTVRASEKPVEAGEGDLLEELT